MHVVGCGGSGGRKCEGENVFRCLSNVQDHFFFFFFSSKPFFVMFLWATVFANSLQGLVYCVNVSLDHSQLNVHV